MFQQVLGVTQTAGGVTGHQAQGFGFSGYAFGFGDVGQTAVDQFGTDAPKIEALAAGDDGGQYLVGFGGAQHEYDVGGRFLQRLQEGVGGGVGQHVGFVNDVDLTRTLGGGEVHLVPYVPDLVDAPVAGGVQFNDVHELAVVHRPAVVAGVAGVAVLDILAVGGLGDDPGGGGLAAAPRAAEQVGVGDPALADGLAECGGDVFLAHQLAEAGRPPLAVEDLGASGRSAFGRVCYGLASHYRRVSVTSGS